MNQEDYKTLLLKIDALSAAIAANGPPPQSESENRHVLSFTEKEIMKMPKSVKKHFRIHGHTVHYRKRNNGRYNCSYELRYAKKPYDKHPISASGTTLEEAKAKFIEKLNQYIPQADIPDTPVIPTSFDGFALYWFENFHKPKVGEKTFKNNFSLYNRHIKEKLANKKISNITPAILKELLSNLPGKGKTEDDVHSILNQIFELAVKHKLIGINPLVMIFHTTHERESGVELTIEEELTLLSAAKGTIYEPMFALMLYAGLRPNEVKTVQIVGKFIVAVNSKRKGSKIEYKKIPIITYLQTHLPVTNQIEFKSEECARKFFNKILPSHTLKDLRKTFNTRCKACKVDFTAKEMFMGHSQGKLEKAYTGSLEDFLLAEAEKLEQWYTCTPKLPQKNDKEQAKN